MEIMKDGPRVPSGIAGLLLLPAIGLLGSLVTAAIGAHNILTLMINDKLTPLTDLTSPLYHPLWQPCIYFEVAIPVIQFLFCLILFALFVNKSARLPKMMVAWLLLSACMQFAYLVLLNAIANGYDEANAAVLRSKMNTDSFLRAALVAAIWIPYFLTSDRVKNTFTNA